MGTLSSDELPNNYLDKKYMVFDVERVTNRTNPLS